jgi:EF-hand domain-containing protein 1
MSKCPQSELFSFSYDPVLTYGRLRKPTVPPFRPHFVQYDKKVLKFSARFSQTTPGDQPRTRLVDVFYYLEDDTIMVIEPSVKNCGIPQGKLVRRGRMVKNAKGQCYSWKDLNLGLDITLHGIVFHLINCDLFTREFLVSNGIEINEPEGHAPIDPDLTQRKLQQFEQSHAQKVNTVDRKLRRFLEFGGKILQFDCILEDASDEGLLTYKLYVHLEDDSVAIKELKENQEGRDPFPMLLKRTKLPKNWKVKPVSFPSIALELTDSEVEEYYQAADFRLGERINVFGRQFLLLDCDRYTRHYFRDVLRSPQGNRLEVKRTARKTPKPSLPKYLGLGTPEDSIASCYSLMPKPPRKDVINFLVNAHKNLRYGLILDSTHPEDKLRQFILIYSLADATVQIMEQTVENTGIQGGKFLSSRRVPIPGCNPDWPEYYTPKDFCIGSTIVVFSHRFKIVSADLYCLDYMNRYPELFSTEAIESIRNYHGKPSGGDKEAPVTPDCELNKVYHSNEVDAGNAEVKKQVKFTNDCTNLH